MLCLTCGNDNNGQALDCPQCGSALGYPAEGSGYLPQLRRMYEAREAGLIDLATVEQRLVRLENAYDFLLRQVEAQIEGLAAMGLDELQESTVIAFLEPLRQGLTASLQIVTELPTDEPWPEETWQALSAAQFEIMRGNQGLLSLRGALASPEG